MQDWLTAGRFKTYLRAAGNDTQRAFDLYQWNTAVNAALLHDFAHVEVALRNAIHRELSTLVQPSLTWLAAPTALTLFPVASTTNRAGLSYDANEWLRQRLAESRKKFKCSHTSNQLPPLQTGRIVADLTFGVWVELFSSRFEPTLWTHALRNAFAPGIARQDVYDRLLTLNEVRNRLAHHEPNLRKANKAHRELFWLLSVLDRDVQMHVRSHSRVATLLNSKP
ncbi:Abi family protein [Pseudarthrobacter sp. B4EP4b]|uniref:Abi family protein n=1 Tax=Pseudarthrobacter sp. B4EP4b TaxID=2590664 RepID=UPI0015EE538D|nr:Abi family protein [Pseudarthrobacter sp. B4EP4b]